MKARFELAAFVTLAASLAFAGMLAMPLAAAVGPAPTAIAALSVSASPGSAPNGTSIDLGVTVSQYAGAGPCGGGNLSWVVTNSTQGAVIVGYQTISDNGTFHSSWSAEAGVWEYSVALAPINQGNANCTAIESGYVTLTITGGGGNNGDLGLPDWLYQFLAITYDDLVHAVDAGIAQPIAGVLTTVGVDIAMLEAPWGNALAAQGILAPTVLVSGFGITAIACYGILGMVGFARDALGD